MISRKVKTIEMQKKKRFVQCMEKVLGLMERVKSGLLSFMLDDAPRSGRPVELGLPTSNRDIN